MAAPSETPAPEIFPPFVEESERCMHNSWNQAPGPSTGEVCPKYACYSCCNEHHAIEHYHGFGNELITHYGPYHFEGCDQNGNVLSATKTGHLSKGCQEFITTNHCITACSPNVYVWFAKTGASRLNDHIAKMPVCSDFCTDFWNACKNDHICFNEEELKEYVWDLFTEGLSEEKDYKVHHCEGNYKCQKLQDSIIARPIDQNLIGNALHGHVQNSGQSKNQIENFCKRFSFGMYEMEHAGLECIDPRDESSIVKAVQRHENAYNQNSENIAVDGQRSFPTTEECPVGLATGAIIGIIVGVVIVVFGTVGMILWCSKKHSEDQKKKYEMGKLEENPDTAETIVVDYSPNDK